MSIDLIRHFLKNQKTKYLFGYKIKQFSNCILNIVNSLNKYMCEQNHFSDAMSATIAFFTPLLGHASH